MPVRYFAVARGYVTVTNNGAEGWLRSFGAEATWLGGLAATTAVVSGLRPNPVVTTKAAAGLLLATDVADYLVAKGLPFRDAHEVVGSMVRRLIGEGRGFDDLTLPQWREHSPLFDDDVRSVITPLRSIEKKQTPQSTAPKAVAAALAETRTWLKRLELE